jgi:hypothetical protein
MNRIELGFTRPDVSMIKSPETLRDVTNPTCLTVLAVTDHIDAGFGLLADDVCDLLAQKLRESRRIVRRALLARGHDLTNSRRPYEAADMSDKDTVRAAFHVSSRFGRHPGNQTAYFLNFAPDELSARPGPLSRCPL